MMALYLCLVLSALPGTIAVTALCQRKRTATSCSPGCVRAQLFSCIQFSETPWTASRQAPLSMRFSRQEYWRGQPLPPPGDLSNPGGKPREAHQGFSHQGSPRILEWVAYPSSRGSSQPRASLGAQLVKNPCAVQETRVQFLGWNETHHQISMSGDLGQDAGPPEAPVYSAEARGALGHETRSGARWRPLPGSGPTEPVASQRIWSADLETQRTRLR